MSNAVLALLKKKNDVECRWISFSKSINVDPRQTIINKHQQKLTAKTKTSKLYWSCTDFPAF